MSVFTVANAYATGFSPGNVWQPGSRSAPGMPFRRPSHRRWSEARRLPGAGSHLALTRLLAHSAPSRVRGYHGAVINDLPLQEDDEMRVFSISEFRPVRYVAINGAVRKSGQFPYREGMTVRDLVLLAGGLEQSAYLNEAEIARLPRPRAGVTAGELPRPARFQLHLRPRTRWKVSRSAGPARSIRTEPGGFCNSIRQRPHSAPAELGASAHGRHRRRGSLSWTLLAQDRDRKDNGPDPAGRRVDRRRLCKRGDLLSSPAQ